MPTTSTTLPGAADTSTTLPVMPQPILSAPEQQVANKQHEFTMDDDVDPQKQHHLGEQQKQQRGLWQAFMSFVTCGTV